LPAVPFKPAITLAFLAVRYRRAAARGGSLQRPGQSPRNITPSSPRDRRRGNTAVVGGFNDNSEIYKLLAR
jgi:hypothetical protein